MDASLSGRACTAGLHNVFGELELLRLLDQFFDRAVYYATEGYEEAISTRAA